MRTLLAAILLLPSLCCAGVFNVQFVARVATNVGANQGVEYDGTNFWTTSADGASQNKMLRRYNTSWVSQVESNESANLPGGADQINGINLHNGVLYVGSQDSIEPRVGWILEFDPITLALEDTHPIAAHWSEGGAWHDDQFFAVFHNTNLCYVYDTNFVIVSTNILPYVANTPTNHYQGATWAGEYMICTLHNNSVWPHTADIFSWSGSSFSKAGRIITPTWVSASLEKSSQGMVVDPTGDFAYWAERRSTGGSGTGPHNVVKSTFNSTPNTSNEAFADALNDLDNLVFHLQLRETSGTNLVDATGNGHNATIRSSAGSDLTTLGDIAGYTKNADGRGVALGSADYMHMSAHTNLSFGVSNDFSFGMFVYHHKQDTGEHVFLKGVNGEGSATDHNYLLTDSEGGNGKWTFLIEPTSGANEIVASTTDSEAGIPYFVVCVRDGVNNQMIIYVDGQPEATNNNVFTPNQNNHGPSWNATSIGESRKNNYVFEPFMTSDVLTPEEVLGLWDASQASTPVTPPGTGTVSRAQGGRSKTFNWIWGTK